MIAVFAFDHQSLYSISLEQIRKHARRATRFMECYRKGLIVLQAEYSQTFVSTNLLYQHKNSLKWENSLKQI